MIGRTVICSNCWRESTCSAVVDVEHERRWVFCTVACMLLKLRERYMEMAG